MSRCTATLCALLCSSGRAVAADFVVGEPDGTGFDTILEAADSGEFVDPDGDRLLLFPGTYEVPASWGTSFALTLEGVSGDAADVTLVAEGNPQNVVYRPGADITLRNLRIDGENADRRALQVDFGGTATLENVEILRTRSLLNNGGAIYVDSGTLVLDEVEVNGDPTLTWTRFDGGLVYASNSDVKIHASTFTGGHASHSGGAIALQQCSALIEESTFENNRADGSLDVEGLPSYTGAAIYAADLGSDASGSLELRGNTFGDGQGYFLVQTQSIDFVIEDNAFEPFAAGFGALVLQGVQYRDDGSASVVSGNRFTGDFATVLIRHTSGALEVIGNEWAAEWLPALYVYDADEPWIANNAFLGGARDPEGPCQVQIGENVTDFHVRFNTFLGETGSCAIGSIASSAVATDGIFGNLFAGYDSQPLELWPWEGVTYNAFYDLNPQETAISDGDTEAPLPADNRLSAASDPPMVAYGEAWSDRTARVITFWSDLNDFVESEEDWDGTLASVGEFGGPDADPSLYHDLDGDGAARMLGGWDCDDGDEWITPAIVEPCEDNDVDDDCDGVVDEDATEDEQTIWYADEDGDGLGAVYVEATYACAAPDSVEPLSRYGLDCDDDDADIGVPNAWFHDEDGDGKAGSLPAAVDCEAPPGLVEIVHDDGYFDCDDDDDDVYPYAERDERCPDDVDWDCDGDEPMLDPSDPDVAADPSVTIWFRDSDRDDYGHWDYSYATCGEMPYDWTGSELYLYDDLYADGDEFDCEDGIAAANPGVTAGDYCTTSLGVSLGGIDDDCDGEIDEDVPESHSKFFRDADGDGYGSDDDLVSACSMPSGYVDEGGDCDDDDDEIHPGAEDTCDGSDDDCDGDDGLTSYEVWPDEDGDGYGDDEGAEVRCDVPDGWIDSGGDCDSGDDSVHPQAVETCNGIDDDCDGQTDEKLLAWFYPDADGDGYGVKGDEDAVEACPSGDPDDPYGPPDGYVEEIGDCRPVNKSIHPGAQEQCNGLDDNCDEDIDEGLPKTTWYADLDDDGYGNGDSFAVSCPAPEGSWGPSAGDCDDLDPDVHPGAQEQCNELDDDCDGHTDEPFVQTTWYTDDDNDGYGDDEDPGMAFCDTPDGEWSGNNQDCDDGRADISPDQDELCNGRDDDCDDDVDEGVPRSTWYRDADGDGVGDERDTVEDCFESPPNGYVDLAGDCDDDPDGGDLRSPLNEEECDNGIDDNCNQIDEACTAPDLDGDGYCPAVVCTTPGDVPGDCDDTNPAVHEGAPEICDFLDDDCDGTVDEGLSSDEDDDGYTPITACSGSRDDCDDWVATMYPDAPELCDGLDNDCDAEVDEGLSIDADHDGWWAAGGCGIADPDCDDTDFVVHPSAPEDVSNGQDDDCDGLVDENGNRTDDDGDGACEDPTSCDDGSVPGDCDDASPSMGPLAVEVQNGLDDDCDGVVDDVPAADADGDGFTAAAGDCDDGRASTHPGAQEICNGLDDDCDGDVPIGEVDVDHDGVRACAGDCDDLDPRARPYLAEDCADGIDNDCNGDVDVDADVDGDGWTTCNGDCYDLGTSVNPGAEDICNLLDDDCDGVTDEGHDLDRDGVPTCACALLVPCDCDDLSSLVRPGIPEICADGLDNDCDGTTDKNRDQDDDGWGTCDGDCNDGSPVVSPGRPEVCNAVDDDCNGLADDGFDKDADGLSTCTGDCDDLEPRRSSREPEICDDLDNDCDQRIDENEPDHDGDGSRTCTGDCDPFDPRVRSGLPEQCDDGLDNDCDGAVDGSDDQCATADDTGLPLPQTVDAEPLAPPRCATGSPSGGWPILMAWMLVALRRQRPAEATPPRP